MQELEQQILNMEYSPDSKLAHHEGARRFNQNPTYFVKNGRGANETHFERQPDQQWLLEEAAKLRVIENEVQPIGLNKELEKTQKINLRDEKFRD